MSNAKIIFNQATKLNDIEKIRSSINKLEELKLTIRNGNTGDIDSKIKFLKQQINSPKLPPYKPKIGFKPSTPIRSQTTGKLTRFDSGLGDSIQNIDKTTENISTKIDNLSSTALSKREDELNVLAKNLQDQQKELQETQSKILKEQDNILLEQDTLKQERINLEAQRTQLGNEYKNKQTELNNKEISLNEKNTELKKIQDDFNSQQKEFSQQNTQFQQEKIKFIEQKKQINELETQLQKQTDQLNTVRQQLNESKDNIKKQNEILNQQRLDLNKQRIELEKQISINASDKNQILRIQKQITDTTPSATFKKLTILATSIGVIGIVTSIILLSQKQTEIITNTDYQILSIQKIDNQTVKVEYQPQDLLIENSNVQIYNTNSYPTINGLYNIFNVQPGVFHIRAKIMDSGKTGNFKSLTTFNHQFDDNISKNIKQDITEEKNKQNNNIFNFKTFNFLWILLVFILIILFSIFFFILFNNKSNHSPPSTTLIQ